MEGSILRTFLSGACLMGGGFLVTDNHDSLARVLSGAALVAGSGYLGFSAVRTMEKRNKEMRELKRNYERLSEISAARAPAGPRAVCPPIEEDSTTERNRRPY